MEVSKKLLNEFEYANNPQKSILQSYKMNKSNSIPPQVSMSVYSEAAK